MNREQAQQNIDAICQAYWNAMGQAVIPWNSLPEDERAFIRKRMEAALDALADIPDASRVIGSALNQARANNERRERMAAVE